MCNIGYWCNMGKKIGLIVFLLFFLFSSGYLIYWWGNDFLIESKNSFKVKNYFANRWSDFSKPIEEYQGIISIDKISLVTGFYDIASPFNDVKYGIEVIENSDYPDIVGSNLVLASHRGNRANAFFDDLHKLNLGDMIDIYYKNRKYRYQVADFYKVDKNGKVVINRDRDKTTLTLITCDHIERDKQIVYIAYQM